MKMVKSSLKGLKALSEKEKLLLTGNFSFSLSVFEILVLQTHKNKGLLGKGLSHTKKFTENMVDQGEIPFLPFEKKKFTF